MTPAQTILNLIETVDLGNVDMLHPFPSQFRGWLDDNIGNWKDVADKHTSVLDKNKFPTHISFDAQAMVFIFSRDALKAIRPKSTLISLHEHNNGGGFCLGVRCVLHFMDGKVVFSPTPFLPTEELAELYAIIKAIEHERTQQ